MHRWQRVAAWFRSGDARDAEFDRELQAHLDLEAEELCETGLTPEEAHYAALREVGNTTRIKEDVRGLRRGTRIDALLQDVRQAGRMLTRDLRFTTVAALTLAIGVGVNAATFSLINALMLQPPAHVRAPEHVVVVTRSTNYVHYLDLIAGARTLDLAAYSRNTLSLGLGAEAIGITAECVTPTYFSLLGPQPAIGRTFLPEDETQGSPPAVILSYGLWNRQFAGDAGVLGRPLVIAGRTYTAIGVAPRGFRGVEMDPVDAWLLLTVSPAACSFTGSSLLRAGGTSAWLTTIARIREGVTLQRAEAEMTALLPVRIPGSGTKPVAAEPGLAPIYDTSKRSESRDGRLALWLAAAAAMVLLIACANVSGLLSIRGIDRRREIAVRLQLGATRSRIASQLLIEHLVLATSCAAVAIVVAWWTARVFQRFFPFVTDEAILNPRVFGVLAGVACLAGLLSGIVPAIQTSRSDATSLSRGGHRTTYERSRFRNALLVVQVALALVLVVGAGLFVRSVQNLRENAGLDLDRVIVASIDLQKAGYRRAEDIQATFHLLLDRVRQLPQVESASLSSGSLLGLGGSGLATFISRSITQPPGSRDGVVLTAVSPEYFSTLGTRIIRGRAFTVADNAAGKPVMILDDASARETWPDRDAVGQCAFFMGSDACVEVVGISEPRKHGTIRRASPEFLIPLAQASLQGREIGPRILLVRTRSSARNVPAAVSAAIQGASPTLPFVNVRPLADQADIQARSWRLGATMFGLFGAAAVVLAGVGLYGVLAFSTRQRTSEIGVRMALGAMPHDILGLVARHGLALVAIGWLAGTAASLAMARLIGSLLFNVAPTDPATFVVASVVILAAGVCGCVLPAVRAARVDPAITLRCD